jgi:tRNA-splicing ligase RtcB (3'-phosphate/5'-hydroxy nucleic acid ligase)
MKVIVSEKHIIKSWCEDIEDSAIQQAKNLANLPFLFKYIALMPDCHSGYGMPIGGVIATKNVVIPNAVGVDIGCGMCAVKTSIKDINIETLKKIIGEIRKVIPVGFNHHKEKQDENLMPLMAVGDVSIKFKDWEGWTGDYSKLVCFQEYTNSLYQLGTLGGGNHFIEIQKDTEGYIWIMIHSGSRNLGYKVANHYNEIAIELNTKWHSVVPKEWELAFLSIDSEEGQKYLREMQYCVDFALANRNLMMERILQIIADTTQLIGFETEEIINIAHNYASLENHFGENIWVHRKGATLARENTIGIIPGSQGTKSYIVKGKGNPESFMSCSHGAGRSMSRTKAKNELNLENEIKKLNDQNIIHSIRNTKDLDEASGAYKDISKVMEQQADLVEILVELTPIAVIKE